MGTCYVGQEGKERPMSAPALSVKPALRRASGGEPDLIPAAMVTLPYPAALPSLGNDLATAAGEILEGADLGATFDDPVALRALRARLSSRESHGQDQAAAASSSRPAEEEQAEHDRYFLVSRSAGNPAEGFAAGLLLAQVAAHENCLDMGVTLPAGPDWEQLFAGLKKVLGTAGETASTPAMPAPSGWRAGYDPASRWLIGHQLFFSLIQGAIVGLNRFADSVR